MYDISIKPINLAMANLTHIVKTGSAHCKDSGVEDKVMTQMRLYPDMLPFAAQIRIAGDVSKGCASRLSGVEPPSFEDNEETFDQLLARCDKTVEFINSIDADDINGTEEKAINLKLPSIELNFTGADYVQKFVIPNIQFHVTTAYAILRNNGVPLGKQDFLGAIN